MLHNSKEIFSCHQQIWKFKRGFLVKITKNIITLLICVILINIKSMANYFYDQLNCLGEFENVKSYSF